MAARFLHESRLPLYLQDYPPVVDVWQIVPGEGVGPLRLGTLDSEATRLLRKSAIVVQQGSIVTCLLRHANGWTTVMVRTAEPAVEDRPPNPARFVTIERVATTCPAHLTLDGVRVGTNLADAAAALGVPALIRGGPALVRGVLEWPDGLEAGLQGNRIAWLAVCAHAGN